jgi:hypothetical protein
MWFLFTLACAPLTRYFRWSFLGFLLFFAAGIAVTIIYIFLESGILFSHMLQRIPFLILPK